MKIKFSRHAKRRASLYNIDENIIEQMLINLNLTDGQHEVINNVIGFKYPIKVVIAIKNDNLTVITCYPLKKTINKGYEHESIL